MLKTKITIPGLLALRRRGSSFDANDEHSTLGVDVGVATLVLSLVLSFFLWLSLFNTGLCCCCVAVVAFVVVLLCCCCGVWVSMGESSCPLFVCCMHSSLSLAKFVFTMVFGEGLWFSQVCFTKVFLREGPWFIPALLVAVWC